MSRSIFKSPSTPVLAKELEYFVCQWIMRLVGDQLDPSQFGAIHNSSTVHALVDLMHDWSVATDSSDTMVRALLLDYRKAFDLIDHHILLDKLGQLGLPRFIVSWVAAFLHDRKQQVKIGTHVTDWLPVHDGVPQGTRLGPTVFLFMVNDLLASKRRIKFVDDTLTWERCHVSGNDSDIQDTAEDTAGWSVRNRMQLNVDKTKEMAISFSRKFPDTDLPPVTLGGKELERVDSAKILGVMISNDLSWNSHVDYICPKANKRLYFLCLLMRAGASRSDMLQFYKSTVRSAVEYACPVWHTGLTTEQTDRIESVQRRALRIIDPGLSYNEALTLTGLETLHARRERMSQSFFLKTLAPDHKLHHLIPEPREVRYGLRRANRYPVPAHRTQRARKNLIIFGLANWQ